MPLMKHLIYAPYTRALFYRSVAPASRPHRVYLTMMHSNSTADPRATEVLTFWFGDGAFSRDVTAYESNKTKQWFNGGPAVDEVSCFAAHGA